MLGGIDPGAVGFGQPLFLWLLLVPAMLLALALVRLARRRMDVRRAAGERLLPVRPRYTWAGDLGFWVTVLIATSLCIGALARPRITTTVVQRGGADFVILQDASASMYTRDVAPDRWQRSVRFLRAFGEALSWKGERVALALFAHLASPQVRLTRDPNALFFFLDHLGERSPFRLEDDPTWDTNIEEGLRWGLNLVEKDEELFGRTSHVKAFVVVTDGQAWSGEVAKTLAQARQRKAIVHVVGVGTTSGGYIPFAGSSDPPVRAALDRDSLRAIALAGGGEYFELGLQTDRVVAARIISAVRRRATQVSTAEGHVELYWRFLFAASLVLCAGTLLLRDPVELWWHAAASAAALLVLAIAFG